MTRAATAHSSSRDPDPSDRSSTSVSRGASNAAATARMLIPAMTSRRDGRRPTTTTMTRTAVASHAARDPDPINAIVPRNVARAAVHRHDRGVVRCAAIEAQIGTSRQVAAPNSAADPNGPVSRSVFEAMSIGGPISSSHDAHTPMSSVAITAPRVMVSVCAAPDNCWPAQNSSKNSSHVIRPRWRVGSPSSAVGMSPPNSAPNARNASSTTHSCRVGR